jgi:heterotetrameric sarcosine oxidase gamma subunit
VSLAFLSPVAGETAAPRSPLADAAIASGARLELREGWQLPVSFGDPAAEAAACRETVGFAELSHLTKLELQGAGAADPFESGVARRADGAWRCPVAPGLGLSICEPGRGDAMRASLDGDGVRICDLSGALAALAVVGPLAREVFARFCALDLRESKLPVGGFRPGSVARTPGYVLREGDERFLMIFGSAYGAYVWEVVSDAAGRLGGGPVGLDALPPIEETPNA